MSTPVADDSNAGRMADLVAAKAAAELAAAEELVHGDVPGRGDVPADVLLLKGVPGADDTAAGGAMAGADGEAADKALVALHREGSVYRSLTRPDGSWDSSHARRLRLLIESVDPDLIIALDSCAATDCAGVLDIAALAPGAPVRAGGRYVLAVDGLEASLGDPARKRRVWNQLKKAARP